ncbi:hypothetical protein AYL99_08817 [Fonsecaea erecta]|uniref:Xylanolytic transcriptional activator regulatory domain-containing protein n=1 Tax=Fonsecaea erecta TaxID=1367422 RepID=A0A178ZC97_9EURO|nr:hypothetical protein AYL99_08817 [Fonsecaea erecta]OAP56705.1 hypothetical protein AYL99_08817 [Fonsecaea erecta]
MHPNDVFGVRRAASPLAEDVSMAKRQKRSPIVRSRASLACHSCRQRKIKVGEKQIPSLEQYQWKDGADETNILQVRHPTTPDWVYVYRMPHGSREHVATLQEQVRSLEALVRQIIPDGNTSVGGSQEAQVANTPQLDVQKAPAVSTTPAPDNIQELQDSAFVATYQASSVAEQSSNHDSRRRREEQLPSASPQTISIANSKLQTKQSPVHGTAAVMPAAREDSSYADQIPQREPEQRPNMASLSPMDNERQSPTAQVCTGANGEEGISEESGIFFGPTCQLHVSSPSDVVRSVSSIDPPPPPGTQIDMDSDRLKTLLFNNYCNFQTLSVTIIHRELFLSHRARGIRSQHYSRFLENSLLACSARLSTSVAVRALGSSFAMRAKSEIVSEMEDPNVATLQGMLLLSDYEMTEGRDRVGWMYCGIACRLIVDLGLHHTLSKNSDHDALNVHGGGGFRASVTLGCFVYETLWSLYLGRPSHIAILSPSLSSYARRVSDNLTLRAWFDLCVLIAEITTILDKDSPMQASALDRLSELDGKLRRWYVSLPAEIALDYDNVSGLDAVAYGLHMQYLRMQMLLHSLPISTHRKRKHNESKDQPPVLRNWTAESSRQLVHHNAVKIAQLGITYRQIFGVENTPSVMLDNLYVAGTVLISTVLGAEHSSVDENDLRWLRLLDEMMKDLQPHFHITARMRRTLARIVEGCPLLVDVFTDDVRTSPAQYNVNNGGLDTAHGGAWGSLEAAVNDFVLDPSLFNFVDFELVGDSGG